MKSAQRIRTIIAMLLLVVVLVSVPGQPTLATSDTPPPQAFAAGTVLLELKPGVHRTSVDATLARVGAIPKGKIYGSDVRVLQVPEGQELAVSEALAKNPNVRFAEPDYIYEAFVTPNDPLYLTHQWGHLNVGSEAAWDVTTGSSDVTIAIVDSGVDETHPDLQAKLVPGRSFLNGVESADPHDLNGHGTHVAGIAGAIGNNGIGIAGMAWGAKIMPIRVLGADGLGSTSDAIAGINWARLNGADIINLSLGGDSASTALQSAIDAAHADGILVVAAMGNDGDSAPKYPAAANNVMAVAATTQTDLRAGYSSYGPHCDIAAPGGAMGYYHDPLGIYSLMPTYDVWLTTEGSFFKNYDYLQGTSQASPLVAGLAALIWSTDPSLTPDEVQTMIQDSAVDLGATGWDQEFGHGRIDAEAALAIAELPVPTLYPIDNDNGDGAYWVDWDDVAAATGYKLEEDRDPAFGSPTVRYDGPESQFQVLGQSAGTWYYRVQAVDANGESEWSNVQSVEVNPEAPVLDPITNLGAPDAYRLSWQGVQGALGYRLQESSDISFTNPITRYKGVELSYDVTGQPGGTWYYRVQAYSDLGSSPWSTTRFTDVITSTVPSPVLQPIDNSDGDASYTITWTDVPTPTGYTLEQSRSIYFSAPTPAYTGTFTQVTATDQPPGRWYYRVRAHTALGSSPWSNVESAVVPGYVYLSLVLKDYGEPATPSSIINGDFEAGPQGWTEYSKLGYTLIVTDSVVPAHSGTWMTWLGGNNEEVSHISQQVTIGTTETYLIYWRWIASLETDCFSDEAEVLINNVPVDSYALCTSNNTSGWMPISLDLSAYADTTVTLTLKTELDNAVNSNLFIDDVSFATLPVSSTVSLDRTLPADAASPKPTP